MITPADLGEKLQRRRNGLALTQENVVDRLRSQGLKSSTSAISRIENGERLEGLRPLLQLLDALALDIELRPREGGPLWLVSDELTPELVALVKETGPEDRDYVLATVHVLRKTIAERGAGREKQVRKSPVRRVPPRARAAGYLP